MIFRRVKLIPECSAVFFLPGVVLYERFGLIIVVVVEHHHLDVVVDGV